MDEDYGTDLALSQAVDDWAKEHDRCPECLYKYNKDGYCKCPEEY